MLRKQQLSPGLLDSLADLGNPADVDAAVEAAHAGAVLAIDIVLARRPTFGNGSGAGARVFGVDERTILRLSGISCCIARMQ